MEMTVRRIMIALMAVVGLGLLTSTIISTTPYDPAKQGGDRKQIVVQADTKPTETVVLERPIGIHGTKFVAVVQVEGDTATLAKGYIKGSTGANFTVAGQSLGFGISNPEFWLEKEVRGTGMSEERVFRVFVNFRRVHFFIFNEQQTSLVGELTVKKMPVASTPAHTENLKSPNPPLHTDVLQPARR